MKTEDLEQKVAKEAKIMEQNEPRNECLIYVPQWQENIGRKLFPNTYVDSPELPGMKDVMVSYTRVHLSFLDRIRVLISGKIEITTKTATENVIGAVTTNCGSSVRPPWWLERIPKKGDEL